ncbi:Protein C05D11.1 [Aphelenchoides avenae]|nr:Protein C05D11.1 [Aphelenchus avenae]
MGSQRYPYKGVLDVIANRCLASGTNAYTDQDHTAYTITTVGSLGFLKVLPVYMDHLLSPMLTDEQYATEVHHINGDGEDGGVVYSEMQDHEAEMDEIITNKKKELLYPPNNSYGVNTGGALKDLRTACSNEKVRDFHKQFYHLKNMLVIVCGKIDHEQLLKAIEPVEERELSKVPEKFDRPFQSSVPPLTEEKYARIQCPSDEETEGAVHLAWFGPAASDLYACSALNVLADYLTNTAVAPLQQDFIQLAEPLCSSVDIRVAEQTTCEVDVQFSGVPTAKLEEIKPRFFGKTVTEHVKPETFDMERMGFVIEQSIKKQLTKMETSPHSQIVQALIGHQLYGDEADDSEELRIRLNEVSTLKRLAEEPAQFWADLVRQIFVKERSVCVVGEPSVEAIQRATAEEEERIDQQREKLGKKGLKECGAKLAAAIKANTEKKPPAEVLKELIVEDLERFNLFDISTSTNLDASAGKSFIQDLPCYSWSIRQMYQFTYAIS